MTAFSTNCIYARLIPKQKDSAIRLARVLGNVRRCTHAESDNLGGRADGPAGSRSRELVTANAVVAPQIDDEITAEHVEEALQDLRRTLQYADPEERKQVVQENVKEIRIPPEGDAELVPAPDGFARLFGVHSNGDPEGSRTPVS